MRILVTGRGGAGSWQVRGEQIGEALGAVVKPRATLADMRVADVILVVKRVPAEMLTDLRRSGRPWAYDIVDAYPQPVCVGWTERQAVAWVRSFLATLQPDVVIWPNARMRSDCGGGGKVVYHHHRPGLARNPVRERIETVGYEGGERYLEGWRKGIEKECARRGMRFVVNPASLAELDVVLAVRDGGYAQGHWKSNVKLANAHGSGTPFIGTPECGYRETAAGGEVWVQHPRDVGAALDELQPETMRRGIHERFVEAAIPLDRAAAEVRAILCALKS